MGFFDIMELIARGDAEDLWPICWKEVPRGQFIIGQPCYSLVEDTETV